MSVNYREAGARHFRDGDLLHTNGRIGNSDHLFGLCAECALKAVLVSFGATTDTAGTIKRPHREHVNVLWAEFFSFLSGRAGAKYLNMLPTNNPFAGWKVDDRYAPDAAITQTRADDHRSATVQVMKMLQQAIVDGKVK